MKPYDPKNFGKPQIRLREDDEHGPNPYDSRTPIKDLGPEWLSSWTWWLRIALLAIGIVAVRYLSNGGSLP